ncbi:putative effector protein [Aphelenchoides bicaudatus]|nr:putative effector protein [Aphelenchoides bicaudatus]
MLMRLFIFLLATAIIAVVARDQSIWAKGSLACQGQPGIGFLVQVWDHDIADPDDKMGENFTDDGGYFNVTGWTESNSDIKPYMKFIHNCTGDSAQACLRMEIPATYINEGREPTTVYDAYVVELNNRPNDC